jgi:hypothetical protein
MLRVAVAMAVLAAPPAFAQGSSTCKVVKFDENASAATVSGTVGSEPPYPCYKIFIDADRTATFQFTQTNGNMAFSIFNVADDRDSYSFNAAAKTYKFIVFQNADAPPDPFTLTVSVK